MTRDEAQAAYLKAENEFSHAFKQMNYWKTEADRLNAIAAEALRELETNYDQQH